MESEKLKILYSRETISKNVSKVATEIARDFPQGNLLLVGILKGSFVFMADLIRALNLPVIVDFVRLASYGSSTQSSGKVQILKDLEIPVVGKDVVVVEDIIDTGLTIKFLTAELKNRGCRSLKVCALLDKKFRREIDIEADYVGITMEKDHFIVGYGIDFSERYRYLPDICYIEP